MLKASCLPCRDSIDLLNDSATLHRLAKESGFLKRKPRKITPDGFIKSMMLAGSHRSISFNALARQAGRISDKISSRQNMARRCGPTGVSFLGKVLSHVLGQTRPFSLTRGARFRRIVIQDSTLARFADALSCHFPARSSNDETKAILRVQLAYDLVSGQTLLQRNDAYCRTDAAAAGDLIDLLQPGDLCLRDLGYYKAEWFQQINAKGAFYLSRLKSEVLVCRPGESPVPLDHFLKKARTVVDEIVTLGRHADFRTRLVALRLPPAQARERRRKLKQDAKRHGIQVSALKLALADWMLLITNVPAEQMQAEALRQLYRLRWHAELVFKTLKSNGCLRQLASHRSNPHHVEALLLGQLLGVLLNLRLWRDLMTRDKERPLSLLKIGTCIIETLEALWCGPPDETNWRKHLDRLIHHCRYDRRTRENLAELTSCALR